jgi:hypothetical protein
MSQSKVVHFKERKFSSRKKFVSLFFRISAFVVCWAMFIFLMLDIWDKFKSELTSIGTRYAEKYRKNLRICLLNKGYKTKTTFKFCVCVIIKILANRFRLQTWPNSGLRAT